MNYPHLQNQLRIVTDGFDSSEVINILEWLEEKKFLTLEGLKLKEEFVKSEDNEVGK